MVQIISKEENMLREWLRNDEGYTERNLINKWTVWFPSFLHSFTQQSFIHPVPGIVLGPGDKMVNKPNLVTALVWHSV